MSDVVILLIGLHGSGKSTFTKAVTGRPDIEISRVNGLNATTRTCKRYATVYGGKKFTIIDTPGLADKTTYARNISILEDIASQLGVMGQEHVNGVIYCHSIQNPRVLASDMANFRLLQAICGENFPHVAFVTTRWDRIDLGRYGQQHGTANHDLEMERRNLLPKGPRIFKFLNDGESHKAVLDYFTTQVNASGPAPPQLLFAEELKRYQYQKRPSEAVRKTQASKQVAAQSQKVSAGFSCCIIQ